MKKKLLSITALLAGIVGIMALGSCDGEVDDSASTDAASNNTIQETPSDNENVDNSGNDNVNVSHEWENDWDHDEKNHWHNCSAVDCDLIYGVEKHTFGADGACTVCGYKPEKAHVDADTIKEIQVFDYIQASSRESKVLQRLFNVGDTFNTTNLALKVVTNVNRVESTSILSLDDVTIEAPDMSTAGVKNVKITYEGKEVSYTITVLDFSGVNKEQAKVYVNPTATPSVNGNAITVNRINDAVMAFKLLGTSENADKEINVSEGKYVEKVEFDIPNIRLKGANTDASKTLIEYNLFAANKAPNSMTTEHSTDGSASVSIRKTAQGFYAENITFQNYWNTNRRFNESKTLAQAEGSGNTQAVACLVQADKCVFENVRFSGYHDTLYSQVGRHIYNNCYIEGRTDYIFGTTATSYFKDCTMKTIGANDTKNGGYLCATMGSDNNGTTGSLINYGYVFDGCTITADEATMDGTVSLGRFWKNNMHLAFINCNISSAYSKTPYGTKEDGKNERYLLMSSADTYSPQFLIEYGNTGAGALTETTPGVIEKKCSIVDKATADTYSDYSVIFAKENGNFKYANAWDGSIGSLVPVSYTFEDLPERTMSASAAEGDQLFNGDITIKGSYRVEQAKHLMQVNVGTVIEFNKPGTVTVDWFGGGYGCSDNATITYKNGKAIITIDDLAGQSGIYFRGFDLDAANPGVHDHTFGDWQYEVPTLDAAGKAYRECSDCETNPAYKEEVVLPALTDDSYTIKQYTTPATTTTKGVAIYNITINGVTYEFSGETPLLEEGEHVHVYSDSWTITSPTFESTGLAVKECIAAGCSNPVEKIEVILPALTDSNYVISNDTATYDNDGTATYTITIDDYEISFTAVSKKKEIKAITTSKTYTYAQNSRENGALEDSTEYFQFDGCYVNGSYLAFKNDNSIKLTVKKDAVITISGIYSGWATGLNINGEDVEGVVDNGHATVTYVAAADGEIVIKAMSGTNGSLKKIEVVSLKQVDVYYSYSYANSQMNDDEYINFINCEDNQNRQVILKTSKNSVIKLNVQKGSVIYVHTTYVSGSWGGVSIEGVSYDARDISHTVTGDSGVIEIITSTNEGITQCAIDAITVSAPLKTIEENMAYVYSQDGRTNSTLESSTEYFHFDGCYVNSNYLAFKNDNSITLDVKEGATITISGIYSGWATSLNINGTDVAGVDENGHTTVTYTATADGVVTIKAPSGSSGSLKKIEVTYENE